MGILRELLANNQVEGTTPCTHATPRATGTVTLFVCDGFPH